LPKLVRDGDDGLSLDELAEAKIHKIMPMITKIKIPMAQDKFRN
jgi:hypothetical protein